MFLQGMIAAPFSGSGKTVLTLTLLNLLQRRGIQATAFKTGPDYIDPMFHRHVPGVESHNLDLYLSDEDTVRRLWRRYGKGKDAALVEGAMGFYDGIGGTDEASSYQIAKALNLPVFLVLSPKGGCTLAALLKGMQTFREGSRIRGIFLNEVRRERVEGLRALFLRESGLPVLGYLPRLREADIPSRHLGLLTAGEIPDLEGRISRLTDLAEQTFDLDRILREMKTDGEADEEVEEAPEPEAAGQLQIAVASDEAFCFLYPESLDLLRSLGAEICLFSPIRDPELPLDSDALILPGGYPELYAEALSENKSMRASIARAGMGGMPIIAECGGYLYLQKALMEEGKRYPMAGLLPGEAVKASGLVRFGYAEMTALSDSLLFRTGEKIRVHSFHHFDLEEEKRGSAFSFQKADKSAAWVEGVSSGSLYAAFPHLYLPGCPEVAERFLSQAKAFQLKKGKLSSPLWPLAAGRGNTAQKERPGADFIRNRSACAKLP